MSKQKFIISRNSIFHALNQFNAIIDKEKFAKWFYTEHILCIICALCMEPDVLFYKEVNYVILIFLIN